MGHYDFDERHKGFQQQPRPKAKHLRLDERADGLMHTAETIQVRVLSEVPREQGPTTTLYRWAVYQQPAIPWLEALEIFNANRIPSAYRLGRKILIPLDQGIIDERGLLAAVRSVEVLPTSPGRW